MERGLKVTINSDDPAYFGGQINQNYIELQEALDLSKEDLFELAKNSFQYSFLDELTKEKYLSEVVSFYSKN